MNDISSDESRDEEEINKNFEESVNGATEVLRDTFNVHRGRCLLECGAQIQERPKSHPITLNRRCEEMRNLQQKISYLYWVVPEVIADHTD